MVEELSIDSEAGRLGFISQLACPWAMGLTLMP